MPLGYLCASHSAYPLLVTNIGVISDTHGLLRPEALDALVGSDLILHAGDIDTPEVLERLRELAPVHAVCGNTDQGEWAKSLPLSVDLTVENIRIAMHHGHLPNPEGFGADAQVIVRGHSHRPRLEWEGGTLHLNPGSAGRRRFTLPVGMARLKADDGQVSAELIDLTEALGAT